MDKLNATCYDPQATMDFSQGQRGITPRNPHQWDLTLHAALEYGKEHGKKVSLFLSANQWTTRVPSEEEVEAVMQLGEVDEGLSIFFGPPCGILLQSQGLQGVRVPHLPPDTIMLGTESILLLREKHGKLICPDLYRKAGFQMGVSRRGRPVFQVSC